MAKGYFRPATKGSTARYTLHLTAEELVTLTIITQHIAGSPGDTLRGYADDIAKAVPVMEVIKHFPDHSTGELLAPILAPKHSSLNFAHSTKSNSGFKDAVESIKKKKSLSGDN